MQINIIKKYVKRICWLLFCLYLYIQTLLTAVNVFDEAVWEHISEGM